MFDRFRLNYRLDFEHGRVQATHGRPPAAFVAAAADIARLHRIDTGHLDCKGSGRHARLKFSKDFPQRGRQAIRNAWTPPTSPGPAGGSRASG